MKKKVAVIGAGASGLMAASIASRSCDVTILKKKKKIGRSLSFSKGKRSKEIYSNRTTLE